MLGEMNGKYTLEDILLRVKTDFVKCNEPNLPVLIEFGVLSPIGGSAFVCFHDALNILNINMITLKSLI